MIIAQVCLRLVTIKGHSRKWRNRPFVYIEKVLDLGIPFIEFSSRKMGAKTSVAFIILVSVYKKNVLALPSFLMAVNGGEILKQNKLGPSTIKSITLEKCRTILKIVFEELELCKMSNCLTRSLLLLTSTVWWKEAVTASPTAATALALT